MKYLNDNHDINFILNSQNGPHIALSVGEIYHNNIELIANKILLFLENISIFTIQTNGLGMFLSNDINLHLRWINSIELIALKNELENMLKKQWVENLSFNNINTWLSKTSLAYKDIKYSDLSSIKLNKLKIKNQTMEVRSLSIIKIEEGKKEQEIKKLFLKEKI